MRVLNADPLFETKFKYWVFKFLLNTDVYNKISFCLVSSWTLQEICKTTPL